MKYYEYDQDYYVPMCDLVRDTMDRKNVIFENIPSSGVRYWKNVIIVINGALVECNYAAAWHEGRTIFIQIKTNRNSKKIYIPTADEWNIEYFNTIECPCYLGIRTMCEIRAKKQLGDNDTMDFSPVKFVEI